MLNTSLSWGCVFCCQVSTLLSESLLCSLYWNLLFICVFNECSCSKKVDGTSATRYGGCCLSEGTVDYIQVWQDVSRKQERFGRSEECLQTWWPSASFPLRDQNLLSCTVSVMQRMLHMSLCVWCMPINTMLMMWASIYILCNISIDIHCICDVYKPVHCVRCAYQFKLYVMCPQVYTACDVYITLLHWYVHQCTLYVACTVYVMCTLVLTDVYTNIIGVCEIFTPMCMVWDLYTRTRLCEVYTIYCVHQYALCMCIYTHTSIVICTLVHGVCDVYTSMHYHCRCCTELGDSDCEIVIVRGINYNLPSGMK